MGQFLGQALFNVDSWLFVQICVVMEILPKTPDDLFTFFCATSHCPGAHAQTRRCQSVVPYNWRIGVACALYLIVHMNSIDHGWIQYIQELNFTWMYERDFCQKLLRNYSFGSQTFTQKTCNLRQQQICNKTAFRCFEITRSLIQDNV